MKSLSPFARAAIAAVSAALSAACSSAAHEEQLGDVGETGQDLAVGVTCIDTNMSTSACQQMRDAVLSGTSDPARTTVLQRAFAWIDAGVMYSQTSAYQGYRSDCSGYVSMAWDEGTAYTTAGYAPFDTEVSTQLGSYDDLLPGDALNMVPREHMFLFGGWADSGHTEMVILEESHTGAPAMMKVVAASYFDSFRPIRAKTLGGGGGGSSDGGTTLGGCFSATLGKEMPQNACVQNAAGTWYQCDDGNWVPRFSDPTACNGTYPN